MLRKANESHRQMILDYCKDEPSINLFIIGDIERYGFDSDIQDVWFQGNHEPTGIVLRYYDNLILYSKEKLDYDEILKIISTYPIRVISGKQSLIEPFYPYVEDQFNKRLMNFCELRSKDLLVPYNVETAKEADALDIAIKYGEFEAFKHLYSDDVNDRAKQIANRISSKEGQHMFIKREKDIIAHGNTAAENQFAGMIGGVFTDKKYRKQGYAKQIVSALSAHLINQNKYACLFYSSEASEKLFKSLGFKDIDKWMILGGK